MSEVIKCTFLNGIILIDPMYCRNILDDLGGKKRDQDQDHPRSSNEHFSSELQRSWTFASAHGSERLMFKIKCLPLLSGQ